ncbi:MAG TPA: diacylglycerol kinase family protein [Ignavibacteriaceae bacterium]|nr:diacylglycerol kinase family protein [Ignavibacteriaceae bacterium]
MLIVVNPYSAGGTALKKWEKVIPKIPTNAEVIFLNHTSNPGKKIKAVLSEGNYEFAAAGGDGTVNLLLNKILTAADSQNINKIKLGAIGLGSSNDFHKPFKGKRDIPLKINFENAEARDIGYILYKKNDDEIKKYFLINASMGITADANYFFNNPDYILGYLKKINTNIAITYSALRTILKHRNRDVKIFCQEKGSQICRLTNLGVVKNPNFSGNLSYGGSANYDNGKLDIYLCHDMNKPDLFNLLMALSSHKFLRNKTKSWITTELEISSENSFSVEFDGEVITTNQVKFGILPKYLKVCHD